MLSNEAYEPHPAGTEDDPRHFLVHLRPEWQGTGGGMFYRAVRGGIRDAEAVINWVRQQVQEGWDGAHLVENGMQAADYGRLLRALDNHGDDALAFARFVLRRASRLVSERLNGSSQPTQPRDLHADWEPPTSRQLAYLNSLGWEGAVISKSHASELIDHLKDGRRR